MNAQLFFGPGKQFHTERNFSDHNNQAFSVMGPVEGTLIITIVVCNPSEEPIQADISFFASEFGANPDWGPRSIDSQAQLAIARGPVRQWLQQTIPHNSPPYFPFTTGQFAYKLSGIGEQFILVATIDEFGQARRPVLDNPSSNPQVAVWHGRTHLLHSPRYASE